MTSPTLRTPSGENGSALAVARSAGPGLRASTLSNLDCSRLRIVMRGVLVEFPGGATAKVCRVRLGRFWTDADRALGHHHGGWPCSYVRVVL